jgi:hypothetical protein
MATVVDQFCSIPGFGDGICEETFSKGGREVSRTTIFNGLNLLCGCFVRKFECVRDGSFVIYSANVESKISSKVYLVSLSKLTEPNTFEKVSCTCLVAKEARFCSHCCAVIWAIVALQNQWTTYPKTKQKSYDPNHARRPLQKHCAFRKYTPIVEWNQLLECLTHDRPVQGGSMSKLKTQKKQQTKKGIGGFKRKKIDATNPYDHFLKEELKTQCRDRGLHVSGNKSVLIARLVDADKLL